MNNNLIENRQIRVFISSTFRDMQDERNYLMKHTFPKLRELAAERDVTLTQLDLRWGITEEESKSGKVVEICLREIENSIPFFIGIIGNRYGWIPEKKNICDSQNMKDRYKWVYDDIRSKLSVTEMEMQFGVLRRKENIHASFYIKEDTSQHIEIDHPEKLIQLKECVRNNGRYPVTNYQTIEDLAIAVEKDFIKLLDSVFPLCDNTPHEVERRKQNGTISQLCQCYVPNEQNLDKIDEFISDCEHDCLTVAGENGTGKSALLANWIEYRKNDRERIYLYYFTNGQSNIQPTYILLFWINELARIEGKDANFDEEDNYEVLKEILETNIREVEHQVVLVLDDVTVFQECDNWQNNTLDWLPTLKNGNKLITSSSVCTTCFTEYRQKTENIKETNLEVSLLSRKTIEEISCKYLEQFGKKLTPKQVEIVSNFKLTTNPRILITLLDSLVNFGCFEQLDTFIKSFIGAKTADNFYNRYLNYVEGFFDNGIVEKALMVISLSTYGLKESEIIECLCIKPIIWSEIYSIFAKHLCVKNGCLLFASTDLTSSVMHKYRKNEGEIRMQIIDYLEKKIEATQNQVEKERLWDELAAHYYAQASEYRYEEEMADKLYHLIINHDVIWYLIMKRASKVVAINGEGKRAYKYWTYLHGYNPEKYSLAIYAKYSEISDETFLYRSSELVDVAIHADDNVSSVLIASKAIELYRKGTTIKEEEKEFFKSNISALASAAYAWNLYYLNRQIHQLEIYFEQHNDLPDESKNERCIKAYAETQVSTDHLRNLEKLQSIMDCLSEDNAEATYDRAKVYYNMAREYRGIRQFEKSMSSIESSISCMEEVGGEYDDYNECFKAQLKGYKGLILKDMEKYEEAYNTIENAIIMYEDIEDTRLEHGNYMSTCNYIAPWAEELDIIADIINDNTNE